MSFKLSTLFTLALLLSCLALTYSARPEPALPGDSLAGFEPEKAEADESCEGVGNEECLVRRTLAAHLDYIYTQKHKP